MSTANEQLREQVRDRYAAAATAVRAGNGCGCDAPAQTGDAGSCCTGSVAAEFSFGSLYGDAERDDVPADALAASLGCGNPLAVAELAAGDRVLDLGSGGGIDVLLSARRVGPTGFVYGVDMTAEMLDLARRNAAEAQADNVEFVQGTIEDIPLPDGSVNVVISNCVINLSVDKPAVLAEMHRTLVPGGRIAIFDVVAEDSLSATDRAERGSYVGCIAGALTRGEYLAGLAAAGFGNATVEFTHEAAEGMHAAIIRASKPAAAG